ncbi:MAG TPA: hypothetical protein VMT82_02345 [candidate division Zixibacteria bacterium]|nr:hypothetical protein [candidate division Zixibacteria bacterium]
MDAKYNWLIDNRTLRMTINTLAWVLWFWLSYGVLSFGIRG